MKTSTLAVLVIAASLGGCQSTPTSSGASSQPPSAAEPKQEAAPPPPPATAPEAAPPVKPAETTQAAEPNADSMSIAEMQKRLTELGYQPGPTDGVAGRRTIDALKRFQRANHLHATGVLDADTIRKLQSAKH